jgi:DNA-binding NtrC family response regulator
VLRPIVLVDDEPLVVSSWTRVLKAAGLPVWSTTSPQAAMKFLRDEASPIAVISDQHMPHISGLEILAETQKRAPNAARVLTTGNPSMQVLAEAINRSHIHFYLEKPVSARQLVEVLVRFTKRGETPVRAQVVHGNNPIVGDELLDAVVSLGHTLGIRSLGGS